MDLIDGEVRTRRLELPRDITPLGPQPSASTNSATCAFVTWLGLEPRPSLKGRCLPTEPTGLKLQI